MEPEATGLGESVNRDVGATGSGGSLSPPRTKERSYQLVCVFADAPKLDPAEVCSYGGSLSSPTH